MPLNNNNININKLLVSGVASSGSDVGLYDNTKQFEPGILDGTTIKITHNGTEYYRTITGTLTNGFNFSPLSPGLPAFVMLKNVNGDDSLLIECKDVGVLGNGYKIVLVEGTTPESSETASWNANTSTLTITSGADAQGVPTGIMPGNIDSAFTAVPAIDALFKADTNFIAGIALTLVASPGSSFSGGIDDVEVEVGDSYEIKQKVAVISAESLDTIIKDGVGTELFTDSNPAFIQLTGSYLTVDPETGAGTVTTTAADHSITDDNPVPIRLTGGNVKKAFAITPDDSADLIVNALSLSCIEEGVVYVDFIEGGSNLPIKLIPGSWNPVNVKKVYATNTTATGIIGQEI